MQADSCADADASSDCGWIDAVCGASLGRQLSNDLRTSGANGYACANRCPKWVTLGLCLE